MKKLLSLLLALVMVFALAACGQPAQTPAGSSTGESTNGSTDGSATALKAFTVTVVHADGTSKDFAYETDAKMLGDYLESQGLIASEGADEGMFHTVDGEKAVYAEDKAYWAFYLGEEYAMTGIYDTAIADGAVYKLVYTGA